MVAALHDKDDKVIAYVDYEIVDKDGKWDSNGEYCFVRHLFIHKSIKDRYTLKDFVMTEHVKFPSVKYIYYERRYKSNSKMRMYPIINFYRKDGNSGKR